MQVLVNPRRGSGKPYTVDMLRFVSQLLIFVLKTTNLRRGFWNTAAADEAYTAPPSRAAGPGPPAAALDVRRAARPSEASGALGSVFGSVRRAQQTPRRPPVRVRIRVQTRTGPRARADCPRCQRGTSRRRRRPARQVDAQLRLAEAHAAPGASCGGGAGGQAWGDWGSAGSAAAAAAAAAAAERAITFHQPTN